ncbi:MAG: hypothetical protein D6741_05335 [Planctomycetota bacterium]|nr:MAG: hypothetical protein D6741_05335 [Planctomycetota bacterium]
MLVITFLPVTAIAGGHWHVHSGGTIVGGQVVAGCPDCAANVNYFGHYPTRWRPWPGETRKDTSFPQAIGAETIRRPQGSPPPQLPVEEVEPVVPRPSPQMLPDSMMTPPEVPASPVVPSPPAANPTPPVQPSPEPVTPAVDEPAPFEFEPAVPAAQPAPVESQPAPASPSVPSPPPKPEPAQPEMQPQPSGEPMGRLPSEPVLPALNGSPTEHDPLAAAPLQVPFGQAMVPDSFGPSQPRIDVGLGVPRLGPNPSLTQAPVRKSAGPSQWVPEVQPIPWNAPAEEPSVAPAQPTGFQAAAPQAVREWTEQALPRPQPVAEQPAVILPTAPGVDGYCPVELVENERWVPGDERWAVEHRGRTYLMSGPEQQQKFLANPDRYAPVLSGLDPVAFLDGQQSTAGVTDYCVVYDGRLYMFSSADHLARFRQNPSRYAAIARRTMY